ncbi:LGFP repeat-containing protein [Sanguibacter sp. A247]|uniref:LGFP repeat-containing protein n=1 Tax=unclassified Sanguibacter TaxID=2645534 RepID=UPI003FD7CFFD
MSPRSLRSAALALAVGLAGLIAPLPATTPAAAGVPFAGPIAGAHMGAAATSSVKVRLGVSETRPRAGERLWLVAQVGGTAKRSGRTVVFEQRRGDRWTRVATTRTPSSGRVAAFAHVTRQNAFRARVLDSRHRTLTSAKRTVRVTKASRTLASRAADLGSRLGRPKGSVKTLTTTQRKATRVKGVTKVRTRTYTRGVLVEVTRKVGKRTEVRTWVVTGATGRWYAKSGAAHGRWGVPVADGRCGLIERGCVHRFTRGTAYVSPTSGRVAATTVRGDRGAIIATARSQVGYVKAAPTPSRQSTKYNRWMGSSAAWCSFFQSWSSQAAGLGRTIPKIDRFRDFRAATLRDLPSGRTPRVGALAFRHTTGPAGEATHVGLVSEVTKTRVRLIDGNTVGHLPAGTRGVLERSFPRSAILYYVYPSY